MLKKIMDKIRDGAGNSGNEPPIEPDKPPIYGLMLFLLVATVILFLVGIASKQLLMFMTNKRNEAVNLSNPSPLIQELKAQYQEELTTYAQQNAEKGYYRIPIDIAMDALVKKGNDNQ